MPPHCSTASAIILAQRRRLESLASSVAATARRQSSCQILESARLERGRVDFKSEPLQLAGAVGRVLAQLEERARQAQVTLSASIAPELQVKSDPLALDVVVRNVLENAFAALAPAGGGSITISARRLADEVELTVRDSGIGFRARGQRAPVREIHAPAVARRGRLPRHRARPLHRAAPDAACAGACSAHSDGPGQGARFVLAWPAVAEPRP